MVLEALEAADNKPIHSKTRRLAKPTGRTRVTNGKSLLGRGVDAALAAPKRGSYVRTARMRAMGRFV
jgi:hypothetical protein